MVNICIKHNLACTCFHLGGETGKHVMRNENQKNTEFVEIPLESFFITNFS